MSQPSSFWTKTMTRDAGSLLAVGLVVHLVFFSSLSLKFLNPLADDTTHRRGQGVDFYAVYQAGRNVIDGVSIYAEKPEHFVVPYNYPYRYHPMVALTVGLAANLVTPALAYTLWILLQELLLVANILLTRTLFTDRRKANIASTLWLVFFPLYLELYTGQSSGWCSIGTGTIAGGGMPRGQCHCSSSPTRVSSSRFLSSSVAGN
jgi:hypothetical protein